MPQGRLVVLLLECFVTLLELGPRKLVICMGVMPDTKYANQREDTEKTSYHSSMPLGRRFLEYFLFSDLRRFVDDLELGFGLEGALFSLDSTSGIVGAAALFSSGDERTDAIGFVAVGGGVTSTSVSRDWGAALAFGDGVDESPFPRKYMNAEAANAIGIAAQRRALLLRGFANLAGGGKNSAPGAVIGMVVSCRLI